ncbi:MAG: AAA family ATPase [Elusimicrobiota bacterium]
MIRHRRSSLNVLLSRLTLAAFAATLPGPAAWAQAVSRVAPLAASAGFTGALGASVSAPSILVPSSLLSLPALNAAPALAPALSIAPNAASLPAAAVPMPSAPLQEAAVPTAAATLNSISARSAALSAPDANPASARALSARTFDAASTPDEPGAAVPGAVPPADDAKSGELRRRANKLDRSVQKSSRSGEVLTEDELIHYASELDENASLSKHLIKILVGDGRFLALSGRRYVYTEIGERFNGEHPDERINRAGALAQEGVRLLNKETQHDRRARGVAALGESYALIKEHSSHVNAAAEIKILFQNASFELLRDVLGNDPHAFPIEMAAKLKDMHFAAGLPDPVIDERTRARLAEFIGAMILSEKSIGSSEEGWQAARGYAMVRQMLLGQLPSEETATQKPQAAPTPAPAPARDAQTPALTDFRALDRDSNENLYNFGTDITQLAANGMMPVIGRKAELRQIVKTLTRVKKNNPLLVGEPGVGKTELINGLAQAIVAGKIPKLKGKNIIKIDIAAIVAGTKNRGEFEERMKNVIAEAKKSEGRVLLFIDEIHMIVKAGDSEGGTTAAQILKDALSDGTLSLIGATTEGKELALLEKDGALLRRFNLIRLKAPSKADAEAIVEGVKAVYEKKHGVTIPAETVKAAVSLAHRYITDRQMPDSVLDLLDDAAAEVELQADEAEAAGKENPSRVVTPDDVAREVSLRTGIPAGKLTADKKALLKKLPEDLREHLVGQDEAVQEVANAIQAGELGYRDPKQPIGSFVFLGPTGVGKTELARALALVKFGSEKSMLRLDMSEFQEKQSVAKLISAPPGYVGYEDGGQLTEPIRRNGYQVVLFDEIEKAHDDVFDVLLQILEDGRLTDGKGRTVDFSNTIIIMTSNIGARLAQAKAKKNAIGFDYPGKNSAPSVKTSASRQEGYLEAFKEKYRPEFVNRIGEDRVIVFNDITGKDKLSLILDLRLKALNVQLAEKHLTVKLTAAAREAVLEQALAHPEYGARPVKQIVDRKINNALKDAEMDDRIADGDAVVVDWDAAAGAFRAVKAPQN